jgi:hypothetical protein
MARVCYLVGYFLASTGLALLFVSLMLAPLNRVNAQDAPRCIGDNKPQNQGGCNNGCTYNQATNSCAGGCITTGSNCLMCQCQGPIGNPPVCKCQ